MLGDQVLFTYCAYGLIISSELRLNGLIEIDAVADVTIRFGHIPPTINELDGDSSKQAPTLSTTSFLLDIPNVAKFHVMNGKEIIIEKAASCHENDIQVFLMGTVFAYVLQYHDYLVLHGSAVLINGNAVIFSGHSGSGKSTIAAAFAQKGYTVLTDDMVAIKYDTNGQLKLVPGWPRLKLWEDALKYLAKDIDGLIPVQNKLNKYEFPVKNIDTPIQNISALYELSPSDDDTINLTLVTDKIKKLNLLVTNTFRYYMLNKLNKKSLHLKQCAVLSSQIELGIISRPKIGYKLNELVSEIEQHILKNSNTSLKCDVE